MKSLFSLIATLVISSVSFAQNEQGPTLPVIREPVMTVPHVDLQKYAGRWYEIASIPQRFSEGCNCTTADYTLNKDGSVKVVNSCRRYNPAGELTTANGRATVQDDTNAKLKVSFFLSWFPGVRNLFDGDYWVTALSENYDYAVVSNRKGTSMWILSRTPQMDEDVLENLVAVSRKSIDVSKLRMQNHRGCSYPEIKK